MDPLLTYRNRQVGATVERQWAKSLRGAAPMSPRPFRTGTAPFLAPIQIPAVKNRSPPPIQYSPVLSPLERLQKRVPVAPIRSFAYGGNEYGNPSYYPLPLGKNEFSTRCG